MMHRDGVVTLALFGGLLLWFVLATALALIIGQGIRVADRRSDPQRVLAAALAPDRGAA